MGMQLNYFLKSKYYEIRLLEGRLEAQNAQLDYQNRYVETESGFHIGVNAANDKILAEINCRLTENEIAATKRIIEQKTNEISDFLQSYPVGEKVISECKLSSKVNHRDFNADALYASFSSKNWELEKMRRNIELDNDSLFAIEKAYGEGSDISKSFRSTLEMDMLNLKLAELKYKQQIEALIDEYNKIYSEYCLTEKYKAALEAKLEILKTGVDWGSISDAEYLRQYAEIKSDKSKFDKSAFRADVLYDRLCMVEDGIWDNDLK